MIIGLNWRFEPSEIRIVLKRARPSCAEFQSIWNLTKGQDQDCTFKVFIPGLCLKLSTMGDKFCCYGDATLVITSSAGSADDLFKLEYVLGQWSIDSSILTMEPKPSKELSPWPCLEISTGLRIVITNGSAFEHLGNIAGYRTLSPHCNH